MQENTHFAVFGAGWFWKPQLRFDKVNGVVDTRVGYTGGQSNNKPTYKSVCRGDGHTEAILIEYDPTKVTYRKLLSIFFDMHDPLKEQKTQYSSSIFVCDEEQLEIAEKEVYKLGPQCTTFVEPLTSWTDAEKKHQKYYEKKKKKKSMFKRKF